MVMLALSVSLPLRRSFAPIGVVMAGGAGTRLGGDKALLPLGGQPLIAYPLRALAAVLADVVVLAKSDTALPDLGGVTVWIEPEERRHPLIGLRHALELAAGRPVLVCAADLPFVPASLLERICRLAADRSTPAVLAACEGRPQPLLGCYLPEAAPALARAPDPGGPLRESVATLSPRLVEVEDARWLFNVNAPEDVLQASAMIDQPNVKS